MGIHLTGNGIRVAASGACHADHLETGSLGFSPAACWRKPVLHSARCTAYDIQPVQPVTGESSLLLGYLATPGTARRAVMRGTRGLGAGRGYGELQFVL